MNLELGESAGLRVRDLRCSVRFHKELAAQRAVSVLLPVIFKPSAMRPVGRRQQVWILEVLPGVALAA